MNLRKEVLVTELNLLPHPEGGFFKETYRSTESVDVNHLPKRFNAERTLSTGIYFLLGSENCSKFHRIKSDEMWHFYEGSCLSIHEITSEGKYILHKLGTNIENSEQFQLVISAGSWFGATVELSESYSFVGCTVSPGFDFADFELAEKSELLKSFTEYHQIINRLT